MPIDVKLWTHFTQIYFCHCQEQYRRRYFDTHCGNLYTSIRRESDMEVIFTAMKCVGIDVAFAQHFLASHNKCCVTWCSAPHTCNETKHQILSVSMCMWSINNHEHPCSCANSNVRLLAPHPSPHTRLTLCVNCLR